MTGEVRRALDLATKMRYHLVTYSTDAIWTFMISPYRAIADDTRRQILDLLRVESMTAGAIADRFNRMTRPAVSKHLSILRRSRLVTARKQGREQVYTLNAAPLREVEAWVRQYEEVWGDQLASFKSYVEAQTRSEDRHDNEG